MENSTRKCTQVEEQNWGLITALVNAMRPHGAPEVMGKPERSPCREHRIWLWFPGDKWAVELRDGPDEADYLVSWMHRAEKIWYVMRDGRREFCQGIESDQGSVMLPAWPIQ